MLEHWVWLSCAVVPSGKCCNDLLDRYSSAQEIYELSKDDYAKIEGIRKSDMANLCDKNLDKARKIIQFCKKNDIGILTMEDDEYPEHLRYIFSPPPVLYWRGKLPDFKNTLMFTIVGTRTSTKEGESTAYEFARKMSSWGCTIVSGMACGIDSSANKGCLAGGAPTIAVLGCGVDIVYPSGNVNLMNNILSNGIVISEFPPGTPARPHHFPIRNRIMAGLGMGSLIVEAPESSGALITARLTIEMGKDLFVVPGSIYHKGYVGSNNLIKEGCCIPVTAPEEIVSRLPVHFEVKREEEPDILDEIQSPIEREIAELVIYHRKIHKNDIIEQTGYSEDQVFTSVMELEIKGILVNEGMDWYSVHQ